MIAGGGHSTSAFYSVILCAMINFSLSHNVLCFSFVVVFYSMYSLHVIINGWMKEVVMCNKNLRLSIKVHSRSTDHKSLLKHRNFDFGLLFGGGGGGRRGVTIILNLIFRRVR